MKIINFDVRFWAELDNGFRMNKSWDNIDEAIRELTKLKESINMPKKE